MPSRLSLLLDRVPRHSRSTSDLSIPTEPTNLSVPSHTAKKSKSGERLSSMFDHMQDSVSLHPKQTPPSPFVVRSVSPFRAGSATPTMQPPDELFLSIIRRRSACARLEEQRIENEDPRYRRRSNRTDSLPTPVAVAYALPPQYFDLLPGYESPTQVLPRSRAHSRATIERLRGSELFLEHSVEQQIDQTIAGYSGVHVTHATPVHTPTMDDGLVSPLNHIDRIYLERLGQRRWHETMRPNT